MTEAADTAALVIGLGNELRGDDGAGIAVARQVRSLAAAREVDVLELQTEPVGLIEAWAGRRAVVLVDTMRSGAPPGTVRRFDASRNALPSRQMTGGSTSTHALELPEVLELARALDRLPRRVIIYAVEARSFQGGADLSAELKAILSELAQAVLDEALELEQS